MRISITLSDFDARKLRLLAAMKGRQPGVYAAQIVSARIEANLDLIQRLLEDEAKYRGITPEELEKILLQENDKDD